MPMEIAVTGGNGRFGRVVTERLLHSGHRVHSLDRAAPRGAPTPDPGDRPVRYSDADINDLEALTELLRG